MPPLPVIVNNIFQCNFPLIKICNAMFSGAATPVLVVSGVRARISMSHLSSTLTNYVRKFNALS